MPNKLQKFADFETFPNCFSFHFEQIEKGFALKGKWCESYFRNEHPVIVELGCGRGEYTVGLSSAHPEKNYIGVDVKGNRIWTGAKYALDHRLSNAAFIRSRIDSIEHCFAKNEVDEIWITFPDPQPQKPRERKRLTNPRFLNRYKQFLKPDGIIHLKTDSTSFYEYTLEIIESEKLKLHWHSPNLYNNCPQNRLELVNIKTYYENLFTKKGESIKYVGFSFNKNP
jgi:tRNA (guanine-N7-)-methyltransferase